MTLSWMRLGVPVAAVLVAAIGLGGCSSPAPPPGPPAGPAGSSNGAPISVVASTNVYGSVAAAVGGDRVRVSSIIDDVNVDPVEYQATPEDAVGVSGAQVVVFNGNGYDEFMPKLIETSGGGKTALDVSELSGLKAATPPGAEFNEHVWYSLPTMTRLADTLAVEFAKARPQDAAVFRANAATFGGRVAGLQTRLDQIAQAHRGARVAVTEPLADYLVDAAGLVNATPPEFSEAIEEGSDPPAAVLQEMLALFGNDPVRVLILKSQAQSPTTDQVRDAAQASRVPVIEASETLTSPDYIDYMGGQIDALAAALGPAS